jgi:hypothetical protein
MSMKEKVVIDSLVPVSSYKTPHELVMELRQLRNEQGLT